MFSVIWCHQCVQEMGNAKARRLYEAFLPECFQRPETDHLAEMFIRDKYEKKKYIDKVIDIQMLRVSPPNTHTQNKALCLRQDHYKRPELHTFFCLFPHHLPPLEQGHFIFSVCLLNKTICFCVQKEKSCDNIPKEPVVFEKMKLVSAALIEN